MKILAHPKRSFLALVLAGLVCAALPVASPRASIRLGIRVTVRNETTRDLTIRYDNASEQRQPVELPAYVLALKTKSRIVKSKLGIVAESGADYAGLWLGIFCGGFTHDTLAFDNPFLGRPDVASVGRHSTYTRVWLASSPPINFSVGTQHEFYGRLRVIRDKDSADHKDFTLKIMSLPPCAR